MRSVWLASSAIIISAGVAFAQTSGPATPEGSTTATPLTDSGSSGTTTTPPAGSNSTMSAPMGTDTGTTTATPLSAGGSSGTTTTPPTNSAASAPSMAPPAATAMAPAPMPMKHHYHHNMAMAMSMPADGSATQYLHYAKGAVKHHNKTAASNALAMAETRMLNGSVPQGQIAADTSPAISSIEKAQAALSANNMPAASAAIDMAMSQSGGTGAGSMAPPPAPMATPPKPVASSNKSPGEMGGAPLANETSDSAAAGGTSHMGSAPQSSPPAP